MSDETPEPRLAELLAVVALGAGHVIIELTLDLRVSRLYNAIALGGCLIYLVWRASTVDGVLHAWGIRRDNLWAALRSHLLFVCPAVVLLLLAGWLLGNLPLPRTFLIVCALYPMFGIAQQFVLQNLIVRNLRSFIRPIGWCAFASALLFSLSHLPRVSLSCVSLVGGFFFTLIYQRQPNIWAVGIAHGLLASLVFYTLLGEDPGAKIVDAMNEALGLGNPG